MRYMGLKLAVALTVAAAILLGFLITEQADLYPGWQSSAVLEITSTDERASWADAATSIIQFARKHDVGIVRVDENFFDGDRLRDVYAAYGGLDARNATAWASELLTPFGRSSLLELNVRPFNADDVVDPRGAYRIFGPTEAAQDLANVLKDQGVAGTLTESRGFWEIIAVYALQSAGLSSALFVGLATLTFGSVLLNGRRYAIWRLHGASPWQIGLRDATSLLPYLTSINLGTATAVAGFLLWYNGWSQAAVFAQFTLVAALLMYAAVGGAYMVGLLSMYGTSVLNSLRGRARLIFSRMLLYPIRVVVVLMIASAVAELAGGLGDLANRAAAGPRLAGVGDSVNVTLPGYRTPEDSDRDYAAVGAWLRRMDSNGRVIIIKRDSLQDNINEHLSESGSEILWVNESFLSQYPLLNSSGDSVKSTNGGLVQVIIPERFARYAHAIVENVRLGFTDEALLAGVPQPNVETVIAADRQELFVYSTRSQANDADGLPINTPLVRDAVVVVLPNGSPLTSDIRLAAWASYGGAVLSPNDVLSSLGEELPKENLLGMVPVRGLLDSNYWREVQRIVSDSLMLLIAIMVLAATALITGILYFRRRRQATYARYLIGRSFWRIHLRVLLLEGLIPLSVLAWVGLSNWQRALQISAYEEVGMPAPPSVLPPDWWRLIPALVASGGGSLVLIAFLLLAHRSLCSIQMVGIEQSSRKVQR